MAMSQELSDALSNPMDLPDEFKSWLVKYLEIHPPQIPVNGLPGYRPGTKMTVSAFSEGAPASAVEGEFWVGTDVDSNGTRWMFQYNSSSVGNPWEFVGGPPINRHIYSFTSWTVGAWSVFGGCVWTPPVAGNYLAWGGWSGVGPGATTFRGGVMVNTGAGYTQPRIRGATVTPSAALSEFEVMAALQGQNLDTTMQIALGYKADGAPSGFSYAQLVILPRTVSR